MRPLLDVIKEYNCIAWVPTIRGTHALDIIEDTNYIFGDVDKYSINIKDYEKFVSKHYLVATSLHTTVDSKFGEKYQRTLRYIFYGNTTSDAKNEDFGYLLGRLIMLVENTHSLSDLEARLLEQLEELKEMKAKYLKLLNIEAAPMGILAAERTQMVEKWGLVKDTIDGIQEDKESKKITFVFDIRMTDDGILLIKDSSEKAFKNYYAKEGSEDDYKIHVPIHRIFKQVMNFVKSLLHTNYHHNYEHDTLLPASNLHPSFEQDNYEKNFQHLLEALLIPVTQLKRKDFKELPINPDGILLYAESLVNVFKNHKLIDATVADRYLKFLKLQKEEVALFTQANKTVISTVLSQHNILFYITGITAFVVSLLKIITTLFTWDQIKIYDKGTHSFCWEADPQFVFWSMFLLIVLIALGFLIFALYHRFALKKKFKKKKEKDIWSKLFKWIFYRNSNISEKRLSCLYSFWIDKTDFKNRAVILNVIKNLFFFGLVVIAILVIYWVIIFIAH